ncbi:hypothetical protein Ddc_11601 [Ditylenchus destructor]|nr:hypothetical protein Ddc_11601 [Ditylenchus destructor]
MTGRVDWEDLQDLPPIDGDFVYEPVLVKISSFNLQQEELSTISTITSEALRNNSNHMGENKDGIVHWIHSNLTKEIPGLWMCVYSKDELTYKFSNGSENCMVVYKVDRNSWIMIYGVKCSHKDNQNSPTRQFTTTDGNGSSNFKQFSYISLAFMLLLFLYCF